MPGTTLIHWTSAIEEKPEPGVRVLVVRSAGRIENALHPAFPGKPWIEVSSIRAPGMNVFECDLVSTGTVTHWSPMPALPGDDNYDERKQPGFEITYWGDGVRSWATAVFPLDAFDDVRKSIESQIDQQRFHREA